MNDDNALCYSWPELWFLCYSWPELWFPVIFVTRVMVPVLFVNRVMVPVLLVTRVMVSCAIWDQGYGSCARLTAPDRVIPTPSMKAPSRLDRIPRLLKQAMNSWDALSNLSLVAGIRDSRARHAWPVITGSPLLITRNNKCNRYLLH